MFNLMMLGLAVPVVILLFVFFLKRLLAWMDDRGWITYTGHVPTYGTLGNAFLELQSIAEPEKTCLIEQKREEKVEHDDAGGPDKTGPQ
jgi:hypothetical protein